VPRFSAEITLDGLPRLQTNNYGHWSIRARSKKEWEIRVRGALGRNIPAEPLERAEIACVRFSSSEPDHDNLVASFKPLIDGLVKARVIRDDKPSVIGSPNYTWERCKRGEGRVRVAVVGG